MKAILPVCVVLFAVSFSASAALPQPASAARQVCDATGDHSKYCDWKGAAYGTQGRECDIDVEKIEKNPCDFNAGTAQEMTDHAPICISAKLAEHIVFHSGNGRSYRIRRLVPFETNAASCPPQPFDQTFSAGSFTFGPTADTLKAKPTAVGCFYKLEVQFTTVDPNGPQDPNDPQAGRKLECRDPHLGVSK